MSFQKILHQKIDFLNQITNFIEAKSAVIPSSTFSFHLKREKIIFKALSNFFEKNAKKRSER